MDMKSSETTSPKSMPAMTHGMTWLSFASQSPIAANAEAIPNATSGKSANATAHAATHPAMRRVGDALFWAVGELFIRIVYGHAGSIATIQAETGAAGADFPFKGIYPILPTETYTQTER
jgi:hypothetical protein